jgi:hypothetical protein
VPAGVELLDAGSYINCHTQASCAVCSFGRTMLQCYLCRCYVGCRTVLQRIYRPTANAQGAQLRTWQHTVVVNYTQNQIAKHK